MQINLYRTAAVVVARFQAQRLTPGHVHLLNTALLQNDAVLLFLGCSPLKSGLKNPIPFVWRKSMVENDPRVFSAGRKLIIQSVDDKGDDEAWSAALGTTIERTLQEYGMTDTKLRLYGSRDSTFLSGFKNDSERVELLPFANFSATELRAQVATQYPSGRERDDAVREGMIMAIYARYPMVVSTVDAAIFDKQYGGLGHRETGCWFGRKPGQKKFRFIGGYTEPDSDNDEQDAAREIKEESAMDVRDVQYIGNTKIDDWRYRGEKDKTRTRFFAATRAGGWPKASDDIEELKFIPLTELPLLDIIHEHIPLKAMLLEWLATDAGEKYVENASLTLA